MTDYNNEAKNEDPIVDESRVDDAEDGAERGEKLSAEKLGEQAMKFASETAYAAAGFANVVADKAKTFYEQQRAQYVETHPEAAGGPGAKQFLDQLSDQVNRLVEDVTKGYKEMADRGRTLVNKSPMAHYKDGKGPFDLDDDADASADPFAEPVAEPANATTEVPLDVDEATEDQVIADATTSDDTETDQENRHF